MSDIPATLPDGYLFGLACAALHPGLRSLLVLDAQPGTLEHFAAALAQMVQVTSAHATHIVRLSAAETDDTLWGAISLQTDDGAPSARWQPGPLLQLNNTDPQKIILIPDLANTSLPVFRACIMLMAADAVSLDRHGQHNEWRPTAWWIAGCQSADLGRVPSHLFDRFALRFDGRVVRPVGDRIFLLKSMLAETASAMPALPVRVRNRLRSATQRWPITSLEAISHITDYAEYKHFSMPRRQVVLARLSVAIARLQAAPVVTPDHVDSAANMLGDRIPIPKKSRPRESAPTDASMPQVPSNSLNMDNSLDTEPTRGSPRPPHTRLSSTGQGDLAQFAPAPLVLDPYSEDNAPVQREATALRLPFGYIRASQRGRGPVVGVIRANNLHDIAVVDTMLHAAAFQAIRRVTATSPTAGLLLSPADIRAHRRAPAPEHLLVVVIDFTSLRGCKWDDALHPYLRWAYVKRAAACVIQVGAADAPPELQATRIYERNVLSPRFESAFDALPGNATPLAHGLELALYTLQHSTHHGDGLVREALLVVLTDGRGNVPLSMGSDRQPQFPVGREGIEDTLRLARKIANLHSVHATVLDPQPVAYPEIPSALADALGAHLIKVPSHDVVKG